MLAPGRSRRFPPAPPCRWNFLLDASACQVPCYTGTGPPGQAGLRKPGPYPVTQSALARSRQTQVMARTAISDDQVGFQRPGLPVLLQLIRPDLARPVRQRQASESNKQGGLSR